MLGRVLGFVVLAISSAAAAADPKQPTGKWTVEFADKLCVLSRNYGTDADPLLLAFNQAPMEDRLELIVIRKSDILKRDGGQAKVLLGEKEVDAFYGTTSVASNSLRRIGIQLDGESYESATAAKLISVDVPGEVRETFSVPGLAEGLRVLRDCTVDLGVDWGFSVEEQKRLAQPSIGVRRLEGIFSHQDYPASAVRDSASGDVKARIFVDPSGKPTACEVLNSSGHEALDKRTCEILMQRARFHPARDIDGKAMRGVQVTTITWRIEG